MENNIDLKDLLEAGVHFGHSRRYWNSRMAPYLYGVRKKVHIINIMKTRALLARAADFLTHVASGQGKILFVGTKRQAQDLIQTQAESVGMPYVNKRWPGGMLTNFKTILQSVERMKNLEVFLQSDDVAGLKKKERLSLERDLAKLKASFGGIRDMPSLPDCVFIIDVGQEQTALKEANKLGIPVVAVVDTNCSPEGVDYVIPGNDDSQKAIELYLSTITGAMSDVVKDLAQRSVTRAVKTKGGSEVTVVEKVAKASETAPAEQATEADEKPKADVSKEQAQAPEKPVKIAKKVAKVSVDQARRAQEKAESGETAAKPASKPAARKKKVDSEAKTAASKAESSKAKAAPKAKKQAASKDDEGKASN